MNIKFKNFLEVIEYFKDPKLCTDYLISARWNGHIECIYCNHHVVYWLKGKFPRFKCAKCRKQFSAIKGTIFENSPIPLNKWFAASYLVSNHKKGISSLQLSRDISVTQRTAWFMLQRIRATMQFSNKYNKLKGIVEIDETYIGGKVSNQHYEKRINKHLYKGGMSEKPAVFAMLQRDGDVVAMNVGLNPDKDLLQSIISGSVEKPKDEKDKSTIVVTDGAGMYYQLDKKVNHEIINHSEDEFVRGKFHTNGIEGFFSQLKRSILGCYHSVSPKHLHRYVEETAYRYNTRKTSDVNRFDMTISRVHNKRLTYKQLTGKK